MNTIPRHLLRNETCYRTTGATPPYALLGCGFMLKPNRPVDTLDSFAPHYSLVYVLRGTGRYRDDRGQEWALEPGLCFQRFPARRHSLFLDPASRWAECFLALDPATSESVARFGLPDPRHPVLRPGRQPKIAERFDRLLARLKAAPEPELPTLLAQTLELIADLVRLGAGQAESDAHDRLIEAARRALARDLDQRISVPALLRETGAGHERLRKMFQARTGMSPVAYRLRCRIDAARSLLEDRSKPIKEIADLLGYPNPYAFSAQFRKLTGVPPSHFRRGAAGRDKPAPHPNPLPRERGNM